jgi:hypothetical protein
MVLIFITLERFITTLNIGIKSHNTSKQVKTETSLCTELYSCSVEQTQQHTAHHIVMVMPYQLKPLVF